MRRLAALVAAVAVAAAGGACATGSAPPAATTPATNVTIPPSTALRSRVAGFGEVAIRISTMPAATRCALLAETIAQQEQGLMNRTDLAGYDGMLFAFPTLTSVQFYMKDTRIPLSIAFFDARGRFVSSTDMEPCVGRGDNCPLYSATGPYKYALEVAQGGLAGLGIGPGASISTAGACPP